MTNSSLPLTGNDHGLMELTTWGRRGRSALKRFIYSQLYLREAILIMFGRGKPFVRFTVENSPPSLYLNFAIRPEQLEAFEAELALPHPLAQIACIEGEDPFYSLTLNVYRVSGLANGIRAEWSTYISDSGGPPRYLIVEAQTDRGSMDPIDIIVKPGHVTYTDNAGRLSAEVGSEGATMLTATLPRPVDAPLVRATPEWACANDYIYWRNGVCDRTFYDAGLANAQMRPVDPTEVDIVNDTPLSRFIDPVPRSVVVFDDAIEFAISPWWNIDELGS